jgi:hypothetical protein
MLPLETQKQDTHRSLTIVASACVVDPSMGSDRNHRVISFTSRRPEGRLGNVEVSS